MPQLRGAEGRERERALYRQPDNPTRWSRRNNGDHGQEGELPSIPEDQPSSMTSAGGGMTDDGGWGNHIQDNDVPAVSYYNADNCKFRRKEGHGPIRMARKQRMWDDWLSWRDNWPRNAMGEESDPSQNRRRIRNDETKNGKITWPRSAEGEEWVQDVHGTWFQVSGPLPGGGSQYTANDGTAQQSTGQGDGHWQHHRRGGRDHWNQAHHGASNNHQSGGGQYWGQSDGSSSTGGQWFGQWGGGARASPRPPNEHGNGGNGQTPPHQLPREEALGKRLSTTMWTS